MSGTQNVKASMSGLNSLTPRLRSCVGDKAETGENVKLVLTNAWV